MFAFLTAMVWEGHQGLSLKGLTHDGDYVIS